MQSDQFESERARKNKLALTTYFLKSKGELPCVINSVFSKLKFSPNKLGGGVRAHSPPPPYPYWPGDHLKPKLFLCCLFAMKREQ